MDAGLPPLGEPSEQSVGWTQLIEGVVAKIAKAEGK
jgi:hypothetical protein